MEHCDSGIAEESPAFLKIPGNTDADADGSVSSLAELPNVPSFDPCAGEARADVKVTADIADFYDDGTDAEKSFKTLVEETDITSDEENANYDEMTRNKISDFKAPQANSKPENIETIEPEALHGDLPCNIFYINNQSSCLQEFTTYDELSEYIVDSATEPTKSIYYHEKHMSTICKLPVDILSHHVTMGDYLRLLYEKDQFMDVRISIDDEIFMAHRVALCCHSKFFSNMLTGTKQKKLPFEITVNGVSAKAFASFLEFIYTGKMIVTPETAADILLITDYLKVKSLRSRRDLIMASLPIEQIVRIAVKANGSNMKMYSTVFMEILRKFSSATKVAIFFDLDVETFCQLLASDDLFVKTESEAFQVALRWLLYSVDDRLTYTTRVMGLIRFCYMTQTELFNCVETTTLIRGYDQFKEAILIANWKVTAKALSREDPFHFPKTGPRHSYAERDKKCVTMTLTSMDTSVISSLPPPLMTSTPKPKISSSKQQTVDILVVGGFQMGEEPGKSDFIETYNTGGNQWIHFCGLPEQRRQHAAVILFNKLYLIGGSDPRSNQKSPVPTSTVFQMNLTTKRWIPVADMNEVRYSLCACALHGRIYAIGGKGLKERVLSSIECYNPNTNVWSYITSMTSPRYGASAAILDNSMYVVGGLTRSDHTSTPHILSTVECFDSIKNKWTNKNNLRFPRCNACLVNVNERLFLCGGATYLNTSSSTSTLKSLGIVDVYSESRDEWSHASDMKTARHDAGVAVAGNCIYIIGGVSSTGNKVLRSIECYDVKSATWSSNVQELPYPARWICCASVAAGDYRTYPN